ncbi:hypothetical protein LSTR_LSTR007397, partial [Laodelphax striatellus]
MIPSPKPWTPVIIWLWLSLASFARAAHSPRDGGTSRFWSESANRKLPVYQVQAVAGDAVFLPCDISTTDDVPVHQKDNEDAVLLVLWYREDLGTPIYSLCGQQKRATNGRLFVIDRFNLKLSHLQPRSRVENQSTLFYGRNSIWPTKNNWTGKLRTEFPCFESLKQSRACIVWVAVNETHSVHNLLFDIE